MPIDFFLDGEPLPLKPGLPTKYKEHILRGTTPFYYNSNKLLIVLQQVETIWSCFRILDIRFHDTIKLICKYRHDEKVLFSRSAIDQPAAELIKAGGRQHFKQKQFTVLFGKNWQSLFAPEGACRYTFTDTIWKNEYLNMRLKRNMLDEMEYVSDFVPNRINAGYLTTSMNMDKMLHIFRHYNYNVKDLSFLDINMDRYLTLVLSRMKNFHYSDLKIKEEHGIAVSRALQYIYDNMYREFTIPELSRIAYAAPTNLKHYFFRITGFTIDDFRTFMRLKPALIELTTTDRQVKEIYPSSHYRSLSSFCAGFRKVYLCTPSEVRSDGWDTSFL